MPLDMMVLSEEDGLRTPATVFDETEPDEAAGILPTANFVDDFILFESFGAGISRPSSPTDITKAKSTSTITSTPNDPTSKSPETAIGPSALACESMAQATINSRPWFTYKPGQPHEVLNEVLYGPNFHKQKHKITGVTLALKSFEHSLYNNNHPTAYRDFGLDDVVKTLSSVLDRVGRQEKLPPSVLAARATKIEVPEHTLVDSLEGVADLLDAIASVVGPESAKPADPPAFAISAEGRDVGCNGSQSSPFRSPTSTSSASPSSPPQPSTILPPPPP